MQERDRFAEAVLRDEFRRLNSHLPRARRTLEELLADSAPEVLSVSGQSIRMKKYELEQLSQSLPAEAWQRVRLPLVFLRRRDLGPGAFVALGDPYEEYATLVLAGAFAGNFQEFRSQRGATQAVIYRTHVDGLLRQFHSLIVVGFGTTGLES